MSHLLGRQSILNFLFDFSILIQLGATIGCYFLVKILLCYKQRRELFQSFKAVGIPGPEPNLLNGNDRDYKKDKAEFKIDDEFHDKYGPTFGSFVGNEKRIISCDLDFLKQVFLEQQELFNERMDWVIETPVTSSVLLTAYDKWRFMRKVFSPHFSSYRLNSSESREFVESTIELMSEFLTNKFDENETVQLDVLGLMQSVALNIISRLAIKLPDVGVGEKEKNVASLNDYFERVTGFFYRCVIHLPILAKPVQFLANNLEYDKTLSTITRQLNKTIDEELAYIESGQKNKADKPKSVIEILCQLHHERKITRHTVTSNCLALLMAGYDTSSTTSTYLFWCLAKHVAVQERLRTELLNYGCESVYLEQVINESMRLYPISTHFTCRKAARTVEINGMTVPKGTRVIYNAWRINHSSEIWSDPFKFDPDRMAESHLKTLHPCAFAPFGLGARKCLGYQLALLEIKQIVCNILLRCKLSLIAPEELELVTCSNFLTKPREKVILQLDRI